MFRWIPYAFVRIVVFYCGGVLMAIYYPGERGSVLTLCQSMLLDADPMVRIQGAQWIEGLGLQGPAELKPFLERWVKLAPSRGWDRDDGFEAVRSLVTAPH